MKKLVKIIMIASMAILMPSAAVAYPGGVSFTFNFCSKTGPDQMHVGFVSMPCWAKSLLTWPF